LSHPDPEAALRRLCAAHSLAFGQRLIAKAESGSLTFREFVSVARELVRALPEEAATYLAALVAIDLRREDADQPPVRVPSRN
jgi:hypothetical protein